MYRPVYPYESNSKLVDLFPTKSDFTSAVLAEFGTDFQDVTYATSMHNTFTAFLEKVAGGLYKYFKRDLIAYEDEDEFMERLVYTLALNINKVFQMKNIDFEIGSNTDFNKYVLTSKMESTSNETGKSGSSVLQSSASTPTAVSPTATGNDISVAMSTDAETGELSATFVNAGYVDKYTNFQGKTNGLHKNEVDRDSELTRSGNYENAIAVMKHLPNSYLNYVLKEVSKHFIFVY